MPTRMTTVGQTMAARSSKEAEQKEIHRLITAQVGQPLCKASQLSCGHTCKHPVPAPLLAQG